MNIDIINIEPKKEPTLRIFGFDETELNCLIELFKKLGGSPNGDIIDSNLLTTEGISRRLRLEANIACALTQDIGDLIWTMPVGDWLEAHALAEQLKPISVDRSRYQWIFGDGVGHEHCGFAVLLSESFDGLW